MMTSKPWLIASLALAGALVACGSASADQRPRTLRAIGQGPTVMITDCEDCGDDSGIVIECKGPAARIEVPWAAMKQGVEGAAAPVTFQISGQTYTYPAKTLHSELIGYPPAFTIRPGDPLLAAMQAGTQAGVRFGTATTTISLLNAGPAIDTFVANCWGQNRNNTQVAAQPAPQQGGARPLWCASQASFTRTEMTICATPELWQLDAKMSQTYQDAINEFEALRRKFGVQGEAAKLRSEQAGWLKLTRNACQGDVGCLREAYRKRIEDVTPRGD
jgi:uncharacterized protein YecT (DUF1311 family)